MGNFFVIVKIFARKVRNSRVHVVVVLVLANHQLSNVKIIAIGHVNTPKYCTKSVASLQNYLVLPS